MSLLANLTLLHSHNVILMLFIIKSIVSLKKKACFEIQNNHNELASWPKLGHGPPNFFTSEAPMKK